MPINSLKKIWIITLISTIVAGVCLYYTNQSLHDSLKGNQVFADIAQNQTKIKKIVIKHPKESIILYNDDNLWQVENADNYYADFSLVQNLQESIASAKFGKEIMELPDSNFTWTELEVYGADKLIGKVQINNASAVGTHKLRIPEQNKIYQSNWKMQLPTDIMSWLPQPLLKFNDVDVSRLEVNDKIISRRYEGATFYDKQTNLPYRQYEFLQVFDLLTDLRFDKVSSSQEFDNTLYPVNNKIILHTFDGLITELNIFTNYSEYWLQISLSTTTLPSHKVNDYIEYNSFLYKDWWFRLPAHIGRSLFMFKL